MHVDDDTSTPLSMAELSSSSIGRISRTAMLRVWNIAGLSEIVC